MGFWSGYRSSLKPIEVEEPIDVWFHRPFGYVAAKLLLPTPVSPNAVTVASIVFGIACGVTFAVTFPFHLQTAGLCLFVATILDCADGQLARLRGTSSEFGRMLDGVADLLSLGATCVGGTWFVYTMYRATAWQGALAFVLTVGTIYLSQFHTSAYDHYKNLYLHFTDPNATAGDDLDTAIAKQKKRRRSLGPVLRACYIIYIGYLKTQTEFLARFDPHTDTRLNALPAYDAGRAAIYRKHALRPMRVARSLFGVGSLVFGISLFTALGRPDLYLLYRLVVLNTLFWLYYCPMQRRASRDAFREMGLASSTGEHALVSP